MKDFDFDELDRAVNSVLAPKDTNADETTDTDATSQDANVSDQGAQTVDAQVPSDDNAQSVSVQNDDEEHDDASDTGDVIAVNTPQANSDEPAEAPVIEDIVPVTTPESDQPDESSAETEESSEENEHTDDAPQEPNVSDTDVDEQSSEEHTDDVDSTPEEAPAAESTSLAAIPVKRGRFMDMVAPSAGSDTNKRPIPSRGGIVLSPSADFSAEESSPQEADTETHEPVVDVATPVVESDVEPEISAETITQDSVDESPANDKDSQADIADTTEATNDTVTTEETSSETVPPATDTTPFIADVPVDKRPLNDLSGSTMQDDASNDTSPAQPEDPSADPTLSSTLPKEYDKDIMAVEANETVGEHDETVASDATAAVTLGDAAPAAAMAATTAEPHPMFDTSTLGHADAHGHHTSKMSWAVVGGSLFIVGAALGVLYFLYGQG